MAREGDRETVHCTLRLPDDGLEDRIRILSYASGRSLNGELVHLLQGAVRLEELGMVGLPVLPGSVPVPSPSASGSSFEEGPGFVVTPFSDVGSVEREVERVRRDVSIYAAASRRGMSAGERRELDAAIDAAGVDTSEMSEAGEDFFEKGRLVLPDPGDLLQRLSLVTVASCSCLTKSPEVGAHDPLCRYRLLREAAAMIRRLS